MAYVNEACVKCITTGTAAQLCTHHTPREQPEHNNPHTCTHRHTPIALALNLGLVWHFFVFWIYSAYTCVGVWGGRGGGVRVAIRYVIRYVLTAPRAKQFRRTPHTATHCNAL